MQLPARLIRVLAVLGLLTACGPGQYSGTFDTPDGQHGTVAVNVAGGPTASAVPATATAIPATATSIPPTATTVPPTATAVPPTATSVPAATATPVPPPPETIEGVAICEHSNTVWHGLVERNPDNSVRCTYGHSHMDNPHDLDGILGPLPVPDISYPWRTVSALGPENPVKHRVYNWMVLRPEDGGCHPAFGAQYSFDAARLEAHADGASGATVRFHSFWLQARACDPTDPSYHGYISTGGVMDYGDLFVAMPDDPHGIHVPLPGDPVPDEGVGGPVRSHGSPSQGRGDFTWYGRHRVVISLGIRKEDWGYIDPADPISLHFYGGGQNGSWNDPFHLLAVLIFDWQHPSTNGVMDYSGFTDRYGNDVASGCEVGPDCVPLVLVNFKGGSYQLRAETQEPPVGVREYDVQAPNGNSLIVWPN